jgi:hypothetical protein
MLGTEHLDARAVEQTWGAVLKNREDLAAAKERGAAWLAGGGHG